MNTMRKIIKSDDDTFVRLVVIGPKGATQMAFLNYDGRVTCIDFGYHSPKPMYSGHEPMECDVFGEVPCYYDGSSLRGGRYAANYVGGDHESIFIALENEYEILFGGSNEHNMVH